jgi:O-antigen/teichoic acid export membrane protein
MGDETRPRSTQPRPLRVRRVTFETIAFRFGALPLNFLISIVTTRYLLPEGRGAFTLAALTVALAATALGSISSGVSHELREGGHRASEVLPAALALSVVIGIVGTIVLIPINLAMVPGRFAAVAIISLCFLPSLVFQCLTGMLLALGRIRALNVLQALMLALTLVAMLVFVVGLGWGVGGAAIASVIAQFAGAIGILYAVRDLWQRQWLPAARARAAPILKLGMRLGVVNLLSLVNYRIDLVILRWYRGLAAVGIYSLSVSLGEILWIASTSLASVLLAEVLNRSHDSAVELTARAFRSILGVSIVGGVALGLFGYLLIPTIFGPAFAPSRVPLLLLLPGIVAFAPGGALANYFSLRLGRAKYAFVLVIVSASATAIGALLFVPILGASGAAIASSLGYILSMVAATLWFVRISNATLADLRPSYSELYRSVVRG